MDDASKAEAKKGWYQRWLSADGYLGLHLTIGFAIALITGIVFKLIANEVFETPKIRSADMAAQMFVNSIYSPILTSVMIGITSFGDWGSIVTLSLIVGFLLFVDSSHRRLYTFTSIVAGGCLLNVLLKLSFHRGRPDATQLVIAHGYSFPSGHAMGSMLFFGGLAYVVFFTVQRHPVWRFLGVLGCLIAILLIGFSRIYLGVHYLSDVAAGFVAGLFWIGICLTGTEGWIRLRDRRRKRAINHTL